ncbi:MAG: hypothetical protein WBM96_08150, partial [Polyangiales bacterium]
MNKSFGLRFLLAAMMAFSVAVTGCSDDNPPEVTGGSGGDGGSGGMAGEGGMGGIPSTTMIYDGPIDISETTVLKFVAAVPGGAGGAGGAG